jgi:RIO-like serine/threonine protein kinase
MAMMRVKNQQAGEPTPVVTEGLRRALTADERLAHEWSAYAALSTQNLSPKPLWRTEAAIVCSYHPFARVAACLKADGAQVWQLLPRVCALVRAMHAMQIVHMDLNLGNILVDPQSDQMMLIDFEYAPVAGLSFADACRCDYLRVINDFLRPRRGGRELQKDFTRFVTLLQHEVPATLAGGSDRPLCAHFPHIAREARSRQAMEALLGVR